MSMTDPVADMLTRIRNALMAGKEKVDIPSSSLKEDIARILQEEGYIKSFRVLSDDKQGILRITLKYSEGETPAIVRIQRISKPGGRVYVGAKKIPRVLNGLGVAILSTSKGVMSDAQSRRENVGGEILCYVW
ncbi:MAG: 30S ribosomal protein S8 [Deltaproteobacteria bacterium]|nr:30S ribosomal protein S8 [Deltaproteobacteria bacterium]